MDPRILKYYNQELQHLREMGAEFAREFPKIAGRLGLEEFECADPYVERLLEGMGFLAARIQLKLDAEFPRFTRHLLEMVYPGYLSPIPSMAVVQFQPDPGEGSLAGGYTVPRGSVLRSLLGKGDQTACEYRTAHEVTLFPLEIAEAQYFRYGGTVAALDVPSLPGVKAGIRIRIRAAGGLPLAKLPVDKLSFFLRGNDALAMHLYEALIANAAHVVVRPTRSPAPWHEVLPGDVVRRIGFGDDEALLQPGPRAFSGYRLLQEYFAFPARFLFAEIGGLLPAMRRAEGSELDVIVLLGKGDVALENNVDASAFSLFCTPAINLFPKKADRIHLAPREYEYLVLPDRTRPMDYEVYAVTGVVGHGVAGADRDFLPFYALSDLSRHPEHNAYFSVRREPRILSTRQRTRGPRSSYVGTETFLSIVDADAAPYRSDLRQLSVEALCTNRDLPLQMPVGSGDTDFTTAAGAPVRGVRVLVGPSRPRASSAEGDAAWRIVSHLSLNYLSLTDTDAVQGAAALRELLALYALSGEAAIQKQIEGVKSIGTRPVTRRAPGAGPVGFARGLEVTLTLDESAFEGTGVFLLGAVLEQFFARYVSLNSFTETVVRTVDRGEVARWPARPGRRHVV